MGKSKGCIGFRNKDLHGSGNLRNYECKANNTTNTFHPRKPNLGTILALIVVTLLLGNCAVSAQGDQYVSRLDTEYHNETEGTTAATWLGLLEDVTGNDTDRSEQTTDSWIQLMDEDAKDWVDESNLDTEHHGRLKRAVDDGGSGSGVTDETTTAEVTTSTDEDMATGTTGSGSDQTESTIAEVTTSTDEDMTTGTTGPGSDQTESTTAEVTTSTDEDMTTGTTGPGSEQTESTTSSETGGTTDTTTRTSPLESTTASDTTQGGAESTAVTSSSTDESTATTEEGSGMEETMSTTTENMTVTFTPGTSTNATTGAASCNTIVCSDNSFCAEDGSCVCNLGYYDNGRGCQSVKMFGAILHVTAIFDPRLNDSTSDYYKDQAKMYKQVLTLCYEVESWFVSVNILGFNTGSTLVEHEIVTNDREEVNSTTIERTFSNFLKNESYFSNCTCDDTSCNATDFLPLNSSILAGKSCADAGTQTDLLCNSTAAESCTRGAECNADLDGDIYCACEDAGTVYEDNSNTSCIKLVCTPTSGCNEPFGQCVTSDEDPQGRCVCDWGFDGANCQSVWLFVLVICLSGLVLIGLVVAVVVWCRRRNSYKMKAYNSNPYTNSGAMSISLDRFKSMSEWDEKIGSVVPTSVLESNNDQTSAFRDNDQNSESRGVTLRNWRVSEIEPSNRSSYGASGIENEYVAQPVHLGTFQDDGTSANIGQTRV